MRTLTKLNLTIFSIIFQFGFCQQKIDENYLKQPNENDKFCINDINKAKKDLKKYKKIYIQEICLSCSKVFDSELKKSAKMHGYKIKNDYLGHFKINVSGQSQGCYESFIDLKMRENYGENHNQIIEKTADSLLFEKIKNKNLELDYSDLKENEIPLLKNWKGKSNVVYVPPLNTNLNLKKDNVNHAFIDLNFIIEKNGKISNLKVINWISGFPENEKYKHKLIKIAKETVLKDFNDWIPGNYKGNITRVKNNFRIRFQ